MTYASTLTCSIEAAGSISAGIITGTTYNVSFSIPEQIDPVHFSGVFEYTPTFSAQTLPTANTFLSHDIVIDEIQTYETSNEYGTTFII